MKVFAVILPAPHAFSIEPGLSPPGIEFYAISEPLYIWFIRVKLLSENDISGAISHERFLKLSAEYEAEQKELTEFVKSDQTSIDTFEQDKADFESFAAVIQKYVGIRELTPAIVNEFVKKIIVHVPTSPVNTADRKSKSFGTSSGN